MGFLTVLFDFIFPPRSYEALVRGASPESLARVLSPRFIETVAPAVTALFPYRHPLVRALITEAKFKESGKALELLAAPLCEYLASVVEEANAYARQEFILIPIPLSPTRRKERGYNQAQRILERAHSLDFALRPELLMRVRDTAPQTSLGRHARLENMQGAFKATEELSPEITYIVFDDVVTTGATLAAACDALARAGAVNIMPLALAY